MKADNMKTAQHTNTAPLTVPQILTGSPLAEKVDHLGILRARIDILTKQAEELRTELEDAGLPSIEGTLYRATFADVAGASRINWQAIAKKLKASPQLIRANTTQGEGYSRMTLTAKTAKH